MKTIPFLTGLLLLTLPLSIHAEAKPTSEDLKPLTSLTPMMRQNFATIMELQEIAASPESFRSAKNYGEIVKLIDRLAGIAHVVPQVTDTSRPGLSAIAAIYEEYLNDLKSGLKSGNPIYLRNRIRTAAGFCFECHTSTPTDKSFADPEKRADALKLNPFQKAEFLAATRQFDKALDLYDNLLKGPAASEAQSTELAHGVRNALILAVRVKEDPKRASDILDRVEGREDLSGFFRNQLKAWRKDVSEWKKEKPLSADAPSGAWLEKAQRLSDRGRILQAYPADHAGDVSYLRSISFANQALAHSPNAAQKGQAFYLLGAAHSVLGDPLLWNLGGYYFEACVKQAPHTPVSQMCFDRWLEESTFHYSGSAGTDLPRELPSKANELRTLAR